MATPDVTPPATEKELALDAREKALNEKESVLTGKMDQTAAEYGRLSYQVQNLRKDKEQMEVVILEGEGKKTTLEKNIEKLDAEMQKKNAAFKELENRKMKEVEAKEAAVAEREKRVVQGEKDVQTLKTEYQTLLKENTGKEENLNSNAQQLEARKMEIKEMEKEVEENRGALKSEAAEVKRLLSELEDARKALSAERQQFEIEKKNFDSQKKSLESIRDGNKSEAEKLDVHMAQVRADMEKSKQLQKYIDRKMPKLERLVRAGQEIREFILAHVANPDAIANKVNLTFENLLSDNSEELDADQ